MKVIDLTHGISKDMPVYEGTEKPFFAVPCTIEKDGFKETKFTIYSHTGTHMDAPNHMLAGAKTLDLFSVDHFCGSGIVLDFSNLKKGQIDVTELKPFSFQLASKDFVLINTGWSSFWGNEQYFKGFPTLTPEAALWLSWFNLKGIGVDTISVDPVIDNPLQEVFKIHTIFLEQEILIIENLTNLHLLVEKDFSLYCLPLKLAEADGSPVRAVAVIE